MKKQKTDLQGMKFGIEIEISNVNYYDLKSAITSRFTGWKVISDCSVNNGAEIVSPILFYNGQTFQTIKAILEIVKSLDGEADSSTGGHIHVDFKGYTSQVKNLVKEFFGHQGLLFDVLKVPQTRQHEYCRSIPSHLKNRIKGTRNQEIMDTSQAVSYLRKLDLTTYSDRYFALNLTSLAKHGTVEFRLFNGSSDFETWKANIQLSLAIVKKARNAKRSSDKIKEYNNLTARYDMRTWLLRLGFIGKEFESSRKIFRENLPVFHTDNNKADTAWRYGRKSTAMSGNVPEIS